MFSEKEIFQRIKAANGFCLLGSRCQPLSVGAIALVSILFFATNLAFAQDEQNTGRRDDLIRLMPVYQRWSQGKGNEFSQFSVPVYARLAFGRRLSMALRGSQATASGGNAQKLSGVTDTQLSFFYGAANFIFNLGFNFPSGKGELTYPEFLTTSQLSLNHYNFQTPSYGQGFNLAPGFTWAWPLSEKFAVGLGASYQYKGEFKPLTLIDNYDPGDEILLTGGLDWRMGETAKFAVDVIFTLYGKDKIDTNVVFAAGNRFVTHAQFRQNFGFDELWLFARYLSRGKNSLAVSGALLPEDKKSAPDQIEIIGQYFHRFNRGFAGGLLVESRYFTKPAAATILSSAGISIFGFGISPELSLTPGFRIPIRLKYFFGSAPGGQMISGLEASAGMAVSF